jgi:hypothetical protein
MQHLLGRYYYHPVRSMSGESSHAGGNQSWVGRAAAAVVSSHANVPSFPSPALGTGTEADQTGCCAAHGRFHCRGLSTALGVLVAEMLVGIRPALATDTIYAIATLPLTPICCLLFKPTIQAHGLFLLCTV